MSTRFVIAIATLAVGTPARADATLPAKVPATVAATAQAPATSAAATEEAPTTKPAPPTDAQIAAATKTIRDLFKADYAKTAAADKSALAQKFLAAAPESRNDPASYYALLLEAADLAAAAGELMTGLDAVAQITDAFVVDERKLRVHVLDVAAKVAPRPPRLAAAMARQFVALADDALEDDQFADALRLALRAQQLAAEARDAALGRRAVRRAYAARTAEAEKGNVAAARKALAERPDDQLAHVTLGRYLCFVRGDFAGGLPHLAKGFDPELKALAAGELKAREGQDPAALLAAADAWYDYADKLTKSDRLDPTAGAIRAHVHPFYQAAADTLQGLAKAKVERRVAALEADGEVDDAMTVVRAEYGHGRVQLDATAAVKKLLRRDGTAIIHVCDELLGKPEVITRTLTLTYDYRGARRTDVLARESVSIYPPMPPEGVEIPSRTFRIAEAYWGRAATWVDVTDKVRTLVRSPRDMPRATIKLIGRDPTPLHAKFLMVVYELNGRRYGKVVHQNMAVVLDGK